MNAVPMRPWQNALAILATFLAAGSLLPWSPRFRLACAFGAAALIIVLLVARMRAHTRRTERADAVATRARIARIRAEREKRYGRR